MTAAGAAAADYGGVVVALHRVSHVDEAGLVAFSERVERVFQRDLMRVVLGELGHVILCGFKVYANMSRGIAVSFVRAAAAVLENNLLSVSQNPFHFAEVEYPVVCLDLNVYRDGDGALKFTGFGSKFLVCVVTWVSLSHLGRHEATNASGEI